MDFYSFDEMKSHSSKSLENIKVESGEVIFTANFNNQLNEILTTLAEASAAKRAAGERNFKPQRT